MCDSPIQLFSGSPSFGIRPLSIRTGFHNRLYEGNDDTAQPYGRHLALSVRSLFPRSEACHSEGIFSRGICFCFQFQASATALVLSCAVPRSARFPRRGICVPRELLLPTHASPYSNTSLLFHC